jgi:hypothetical protein
MKRHPLENQRVTQPGGWWDQTWLAPTLARFAVLTLAGAFLGYCIAGVFGI